VLLACGLLKGSNENCLTQKYKRQQANHKNFRKRVLKAERE
jgi:hypothetical protein